MELNRYHYFFMGVILALMGLQFRLVSEYTLTAEATRFLAQRTQGSGSDGAILALSSDIGAEPRKVIQPPEWLGWCVMSVGAVLILHSLAMRKPGAP